MNVSEKEWKKVQFSGLHDDELLVVMKGVHEKRSWKGTREASNDVASDRR